eukprot:15325215-Alexandrium_andersonii.AAC.1
MQSHCRQGQATLHREGARGGTHPPNPANQRKSAEQRVRPDMCWQRRCRDASWKTAITKAMPVQ